MHDDLLHALLPIIPRTVYQDVRRLNTLVWAVGGLSLTNTVRLDAWAEVTQGRAQYAASRVRRFSALCFIILLFPHRSGTSLCCKPLSLTGLWISASTLPWTRRLSPLLC